MTPTILGIGGANMDIHGRSDAPVRLRDSNPGVLHTSPGGVCRNICHNLASLGLPVSLVCAMGDDVYAKALVEHCEAAGIDMSHAMRFPGRRTGTYISVMDDAGDMLVGMSDMSILAEMGLQFADSVLPLVNTACLCVTDTNLPAETLAYLGSHSRVPVFIDPVSCAKAQKLVECAGVFHTIKPNLMEMEVLAQQRIQTPAQLAQACDTVLAKGTQQLFVSLGADGLFYKNADGICLHKKSRPAPMVNATGAGDATMAGIIYAFLHQLSPRDTLDFAVGCGLAAIACDETIHPAMSPALVAHLCALYLS